jgi:hypothetical protein
LGQTDVFSWPRPSLALLRGTNIGAAEVPMFQPMIFEDRFDAVLIDAPAPGSLPREYCDDPDYVKMRSFRLGLRGESDQLSRHCGLK